MLKAYVVGLFGAALVVLLAAAVWFGVQGKQDEGLVWGNKTYSSREEFNGYLKSKGLSYKTWLARNPGVAPWEPEPAPPAEKLRRPASTAAAEPDDGSVLPSLFLPAFGLTLVLGFVVMLLRGRRPATARLATDVGTLRVPRAQLGGRGSTLSATASASTQRLGRATMVSASRVAAAAPVYGSRAARAFRVGAQLLVENARINGIGVRQVMIGVLVVIGASAWGLLVVMMLSAL